MANSGYSIKSKKILPICAKVWYNILNKLGASLRRTPQRGKEVLLMKMIYAIVRNDNEDDVVSQLTQHHYSVTRLSTTGGFLRKGNTTLMIGAEDEKVDEVISLIKQECGQHQKLTVNMPYISGTSMVNYATMPMHVEVGGATIFVVNVERYEKI